MNPYFRNFFKSWQHGHRTITKPFFALKPQAASIVINGTEKRHNKFVHPLNHANGKNGKWGTVSNDIWKIKLQRAVRCSWGYVSTQETWVALNWIACYLLQWPIEGCCVTTPVTAEFKSWANTTCVHSIWIKHRQTQVVKEKTVSWRVSKKQL